MTEFETILTQIASQGPEYERAEVYLDGWSKSDMDLAFSTLEEALGEDKLFEFLRADGSTSHWPGEYNPEIRVRCSSGGRILAKAILAREPDDSELISIDSANWAAVRRAASPADVLQIRNLATQLRVVIIQSDADETTRLNAIKRVDAAITLLEAPDISWKQVAEIFNSPYLAAFLTAANIVQLILSLAS
jgi:hypothetical protein